jgi:class 3 adenylate cyclase/tetratricopeptide (TPR) repeat protein
MSGAITRWLEDLDLGKYADVFIENEVGLRDLPHLTDDDLREIGLPLGPRRRIMGAIQDLAAAPVESDGAGPPSTASAERRLLTVMFCDLVGSTELSHRLDPEDLREVMRHYQDAVSAVITDHDGYVASYLGDGVMAYFGWPLAHEDQSIQAARAGLAAITVVNAIAVPGTNDETLAARVGIATGQVVVGDLTGERASQRGAVSGETPNLAARLQDIAKPGDVMIGAVTRRLLANSFELEDRGAHGLKGFADPVSTWCVLGERATESRFEAARGQTLTRFVGRNSELQLLLDRWSLAKGREGQVVLISGEPGIGKSRLMQELRDHVEREPHYRLRYQCSPYHTTSPLYPIIRRLEQAAGFKAGDSDAIKLKRIETLLSSSSDGLERLVPLFAALLSVPIGQYYPGLELSPERQSQLTIEALTDQVLALAERRPVLFAFEDAHWIDPTTLELLTHSVSRIMGAAVMMVITHRPLWSAPFANEPHVSALALNRMGRGAVAEIVRSVLGDASAEHLLAQIAERSDGIPLYAEEITKSLMESGTEFAESEIPTSLYASLLARLDRLGPEAKEIGQIGAVIGRDFSHSLLAAAAQKSESDLASALDRLVGSELVYCTGVPPDATYTFKHALIQDAAYGSLLNADRRVYHARIGDAIRHSDPATAATRPELLAYHYQEAGNSDRALQYWSEAGDLAAGKFAADEAAAHYANALSQVDGLSDAAQRQSHELRLNLRLADSLMLTRGFISDRAYDAWDRARSLAALLNQPEEYARASVGIAPMVFAQARYHDALKLCSELDLTGNSSLDMTVRVQIEATNGVCRLCLGDLKDAETAFAAALTLDQEAHCTHRHPFGGADPAVSVRSYYAWISSILGYPSRAMRIADEAMQAAERSDHPFSLVWGVLALTRAQLRNGLFVEAETSASRVLELAEKYGFDARIQNALIHRGEALIALGDGQRGCAELRAGLKGWEETGGRFHLSHWNADAAHSALKANLRDDAASFLAQAEKVQQETGERTSEAEILRLRGALMRLDGQHSEAEQALSMALQTARTSGAQTYVLRTATELAGLWRDQGKIDEAQDLLAPAYGWFTEGFDTPELQDAKELLDKLS